MNNGKIIIIDNGSYKCRVGYNYSEKPVLEFRNLVAKPRKDKRRETIGNENVYQIGNEIDVDAMRLLIKSQFEKNVVTHPIYQEHIFDYIFGKLATAEDWLPHPILMTEPLANPSYCRQAINELLFECYNVPGVCYGIDSIFSWQHNRQQYHQENDALILSFGYHTTHVVPILQGQLQHDNVRRLNLGGNQIVSYLFRLLQMKYPAHLNAITLTRVENIYHNHSSIAINYLEELRKWNDLHYYNEHVKKIQLPYVQAPTVSSMTAEEKLKKRKEMAKRLVEANQKRLKDRREENGQDKVVNPLPSRPRNKSLQPPVNIKLRDWLKDIKHKQELLLQKKSNRTKQRQEIMKRHTLASQERMRIISLLASNEKGFDEFGKDDNDWDVYKKISHENESDSDAENEKLLEYENILKYHQAHLEKDESLTEHTAELYQLHIGVESLRAPELLFQPSMTGSCETGLADLIDFVFRTFSPDMQQKLANNVYITGGCSQLPGLKERLYTELCTMRPFETTFNIKESQNPSLDSWFGARDFSNCEIFENYMVTKEEYTEKGSDYFKEYSTSNKFYPYPKNGMSAKRYISNEFRNVLSTRLQNPKGFNPSLLQLSIVNKSVNALNLDLFLNNLSEYDERRSQILDLLTTLRASKLTQDTLDSTHFAAVRYLLDNFTIQELLPIVTDRVKYGVFLDNFTAYAILETAHQNKEYVLALPLILKLIQNEEVDCEYIKIFYVKACMVALQQKMNKEPITEQPVQEAISSEEHKVRVKFLRNPLIIDEYKEWSKAMLKICNTLTEGASIKANAYILGIVLSKIYDKLPNTIASVSKGFHLYEDVVTLCLEFLKRQNQMELAIKFQSFIDPILNKEMFTTHLDNTLKVLANKEEPKLITDQEALFSEWQRRLEELKQKLDKKTEEKERTATVEQILKDLKEKERMLWFFEKEEEIDLEIDNKKVYYPKRWFGKKKKPKTVDENYVPPEIRRIN